MLCRSEVIFSRDIKKRQENLLLKLKIKQVTLTDNLPTAAIIILNLTAHLFFTMLFSPVLFFATAAMATPLHHLQGLDLFKRQNTCGNNAQQPQSDDLGPVTASNLNVEGTREQFSISFSLRNENTGIDTTCSKNKLSIGSTDTWLSCAPANTGAIAKFK